MKKLINNSFKVAVVIAMLATGIINGDILGVRLASIESVQANGFGGWRYTVDLGNTTVRRVTNNAIGTHLATIPRGASLDRTIHAPRRLNGWTWFRGTLVGNSTQTGGIGANTAVWISTSQLTRNAPTQSEIDNGFVCDIIAGETSLRNDPTLGISGTVARIPRGARFVPTDNQRVSNGGFTWVLGSIHGTTSQTTGTVAAENANGSTRTRFNHGVVWIATTQLRPREPMRRAGWCQ